MKKLTNLYEKIEPILLQVEKPARYTGGELNSIIKDENDTEVNFGFCFPDTYEIGMSYLGLQIIYDVLNGTDGVWCQRYFSPADDMEQLMRRNGVPLFSIEKKTPASEMDILGFTLQYELCYTNVLNMLDLAGVPFLSSERSEADPIVCAGGNCSFNPEPMHKVFDFFMVGDGEDVLVEVAEVMKRRKREGLSRRETLVLMSKLEGVYVPEFYEHVYDEAGALREIRPAEGFCFKEEGCCSGCSCGDAGGQDLVCIPRVVYKRVVEDMDSAPYPVNPIVPLIDVVHDRSVVEIFRGCTRGCRFCQAGMICRPVRERSVGKILELADAQLKATGHEELSLLSLSTSDYSNVEELVHSLMDDCKVRNVGLSLPSLRLDSFSFSVLQEIQEYRKSGLTFAPEAGTQRLRDVINKTITEEQIYTAVEKAIKLGWTNIKLYFMIGLPTETDEDLDGIVKIASDINDIYLRVTEKKTRFNLTVSVSNFVPKPHTPFQWAAQDTPEEFTRKHIYLKEALKKVRGVTFQYHGTDTSVLEGVMARGDRRVCDAVIKAWESGCRFDSWSEFFDYSKWLAAFKETGIEVEDYTSSPLFSDPDCVLPWDTISSGVSRDFFKRELALAKAERQTPDCRNGCIRCGITDMSACPASEGFFKGREY